MWYTMEEMNTDNMTEGFKEQWKNGLPLKSSEASWAHAGWNGALEYYDVERLRLVAGNAKMLIEDMLTVCEFYESAIEIDVYHKDDEGEQFDGPLFERKILALHGLINKALGYEV